MKHSFAAFAGFLLSTTIAAHAEPAKILVFDTYFDNTSVEKTTAEEQARIKKMSDDLRAALEKSGAYDVISGSDITFASIQNSGQCSTEELAAAQKSGAKLVACSWLQKVSNLILNINLVIEDAKTGQTVHGGSVDIRGNTDLSWDRGLKYLLEEHIFQN